MKAVLSRKYGNTETRGRMIVFDADTKALEVVALEPPDNGNQKNVSCIPEGVYEVIKIVRPNGNPAFQILNVPGRSAILIHKGNYVTGKKVDSEGCILPGLYFTDINDDGFIDVAESTVAMNRLLNVLPDKFELYII